MFVHEGYFIFHVNESLTAINSTFNFLEVISVEKYRSRMR